MTNATDCDAEIANCWRSGKTKPIDIWHHLCHKFLNADKDSPAFFLRNKFKQVTNDDALIDLINTHPDLTDPDCIIIIRVFLSYYPEYYAVLSPTLHDKYPLTTFPSTTHFIQITQLAEFCALNATSEERNVYLDLLNAVTIHHPDPARLKQEIVQSLLQNPSFKIGLFLGALGRDWIDDDYFNSIWNEFSSMPFPFCRTRFEFLTGLLMESWNRLQPEQRDILFNKCIQAMDTHTVFPFDGFILQMLFPYFDEFNAYQKETYLLQFLESFSYYLKGNKFFKVEKSSRHVETKQNTFDFIYDLLTKLINKNAFSETQTTWLMNMITLQFHLLSKNHQHQAALVLQTQTESCEISQPTCIQTLLYQMTQKLKSKKYRDRECGIVAMENLSLCMPHEMLRYHCKYFFSLSLSNANLQNVASIACERMVGYLPWQDFQEFAEWALTIFQEANTSEHSAQLEKFVMFKFACKIILNWPEDGLDTELYEETKQALYQLVAISNEATLMETQYQYEACLALWSLLQKNSKNLNIITKQVLINVALNFNTLTEIPMHYPTFLSPQETLKLCDKLFSNNTDMMAWEREKLLNVLKNFPEFFATFDDQPYLQRQMGIKVLQKLSRYTTMNASSALFWATLSLAHLIENKFKAPELFTTLTDHLIPDLSKIVLHHVARM